MHLKGGIERQRMQALQDNRPKTAGGSPRFAAQVPALTGLRQYLAQAGVGLGPAAFAAMLGACACGAALAAACAVPAYLIPAAALIGAAMPYFWMERRVRTRAAQFAADYPSVLLAAASSIKAGMTTISAFERAIALLPRQSICAAEMRNMLQSLGRPAGREAAVMAFGQTVRQPDLPLFRQAFLLSLDHGGRFAPTLERLAKVSRDREVLLRSAQVSTATMRMTANVLLCTAPLVVVMIAVRTKNYWEIVLHNETANTMASIGCAVIAGGYLILRRMSDFKP